MQLLITVWQSLSSPKFAEAYNNRGNIKFDLGDNSGAIADMSKAAELFRQQGRMDLYQTAINNLRKIQGG